MISFLKGGAGRSKQTEKGRRGPAYIKGAVSQRPNEAELILFIFLSGNQITKAEEQNTGAKRCLQAEQQAFGFAAWWFEDAFCPWLIAGVDFADGFFRSAVRADKLGIFNTLQRVFRNDDSYKQQNSNGDFNRFCHGIFLTYIMWLLNTGNRQVRQAHC